MAYPSDRNNVIRNYTGDRVLLLGRRERRSRVAADRGSHGEAVTGASTGARLLRRQADPGSGAHSASKSEHLIVAEISTFLRQPKRCEP